MGLKERIEISFVGSLTFQNNDKIKRIGLTSLDNKQKCMLSVTGVVSSMTFVRLFRNRQDLKFNQVTTVASY